MGSHKSDDACTEASATSPTLRPHWGLQHTKLGLQLDRFATAIHKRSGAGFLMHLHQSLGRKNANMGQNMCEDRSEYERKGQALKIARSCQTRGNSEKGRDAAVVTELLQTQDGRMEGSCEPGRACRKNCMCLHCMCMHVGTKVTTCNAMSFVSTGHWGQEHSLVVVAQQVVVRLPAHQQLCITILSVANSRQCITGCCMAFRKSWLVSVQHNCIPVSLSRALRISTSPFHLVTLPRSVGYLCFERSLYVNAHHTDPGLLPHGWSLPLAGLAGGGAGGGPCTFKFYCVRGPPSQ